MHPMFAGKIVAGKLGGGDQTHPLLHRMIIGVADTEQGIMIRDRQCADAQPGSHERQAANGHRAI